MNRWGKILLVTALVGVVGIAFRVSWNALRDIANAVGADAVAARLYPFVVDGLMALALVATLVLAGRDRTFALRVLGAYTLASLALNYVHGLVPELHGRSADWVRLADWGPGNYVLVLLATSLPVGSIYFGSDLVAKVLHRPAPIVNEGVNAEESAKSAGERSTSELRESAPEAITVDRLPLPRPVTVGFLKSVPPFKLAPVIESTPVRPIEGRALAAESPRPRRATGRVPDAARPTRSKRSYGQLLDEARRVTADWPDTKLTAEGIRRELHTAPANARMLRDTLRADRAKTAA